MYSSDSQVWFAFILYLAITFGLAYFAHRRASKKAFMEDFFVAGRQIGPWVLGLTWIATAASGGTFIGSPALAHTYGWSVMLWICSYMVVATMGMGLFGKRIAEIGRRTGALTFPDLLRDRFESKAIGNISGFAIVVLHIAYLVAQYVAGARVIEAVLGVPYHVGVLGFALTVSLYTAYGGFRAVAWTDAFQAIVMLFGVLITAGFAVRKMGGLSVVFDELVGQSPDLVATPGPDNFLPLPAAISFFCVWALASPAQPALITRFLACRDTKALKRACFLIGVYITLLYPCVIGIGIVGRTLVPNLEAADHATAATIVSAVPAVLAGFVLAAHTRLQLRRSHPHLPQRRDALVGRLADLRQQQGCHGRGPLRYGRQASHRQRRPAAHQSNQRHRDHRRDRQLVDRAGVAPHPVHVGA